MFEDCSQCDTHVKVNVLGQSFGWRPRCLCNAAPGVSAAYCGITVWTQAIFLLYPLLCPAFKSAIRCPNGVALFPNRYPKCVLHMLPRALIPGPLLQFCRAIPLDQQDRLAPGSILSPLQGDGEINVNSGSS